MNGYTVFISYLFVPLSGYSQAIHCNYIDRLELNPLNPYIEKIRLGFSDINDFKFLDSNTGVTTGYSAHKIYALLQLVHYTNVDDLSDVKPDPALWKKYDLTHQIPTYPTGTTRLLSAADMKRVVFEIPLLNYDTTGFTGFSEYNLDYLTYPVVAETDKLCFGDEVYFLGNVTTDIKADVYVLELPISLLLDEFNSSTNATWDNSRDNSVAISEVGIYANVNGTKELVAIGKLNDPITKDSTISRTIVFAIDF
jgi:hypothetical protein